jgi:hypothetical protein
MADDNHDEDEAPRSVLEEAEAAKGAKSGQPDRTRQIMTGAAIGIGSAALVAALLYANARRKRGGDSS